MSRADLPAALVQALERHDAQVARLWDRTAVLPADETPAVLIELAERISELFERFAGDALAEELRSHFGRDVGRVRAREVTEPFHAGSTWFRFGSYMGDVPEESAHLRELDALLMELVDRCSGRDWTTPERRQSLTRWQVKKYMAARHGVTLDLSPEEWRQL